MAKVQVRLELTKEDLIDQMVAQHHKELKALSTKQKAEYQQARDEMDEKINKVSKAILERGIGESAEMLDFYRNQSPLRTGLGIVRIQYKGYPIGDRHDYVYLEGSIPNWTHIWNQTRALFEKKGRQFWAVVFEIVESPRGDYYKQVGAFRIKGWITTYERKQLETLYKVFNNAQGKLSATVGKLDSYPNYRSGDLKFATYWVDYAEKCKGKVVKKMIQQAQDELGDSVLALPQDDALDTS